MSDTPPKLRIVDEEASAEEEVLRLGKEAPERVARLKPGGPPEVERIESAPRESFDGRSSEPDMGLLLDAPALAEEVESPWGLKDGRVAGVPYGWFVLVGLMLAGLIVWSIRAAGRGERNVEETKREVMRIVEDDAAAEAAATQLVDRVEQVLRRYLAADTVEDTLPWIRDPERVRPLLEDWMARHPGRSLKFTRMGMFHPSLLENFWLVRVDVENGPTQHIQLEQTGDTEVKVDWESHVCYQPMLWDHFAAKRPDDRALDFRVWATPDNHFSHEFSDSGRWVCFRLTARDSEEWLYGYAPAGSEAASWMTLATQASRNAMTPFLLRLRVPTQAASPRGAVIESVLTQGWTIVDGPKDGP